MGTSLYWRPAKRIGKDLPDMLKFKLREKHGHIDREYGHVDKGFLEGLAACGIHGASELIEAIEKHGEVELYEE